MHWRLPAGLVALLSTGVVVGVLVSSGMSESGDADTRLITTTQTATAAIIPPGSLITRVRNRPLAGPIKPGFVGLSFEFQAVRVYTGSDPDAINPVLLRLIRNITPGQAPVLRIGGDSTDVSYAPGPGVTPPPYEAYQLTKSWMATTAALQTQLGARMIMGVNLAAGDPGLGAAEARDYEKAFGPGAIQALEIGNEPNLFANVTKFHLPSGESMHARPAGYDYAQFENEFAATASAAPALTLAGPALAVGPTAGPGSWIDRMHGFLTQTSRMRTLTVHRYPLRKCFVSPRSPQYPTVSHLLADYATTWLARNLRPWIRVAHANHRAIRADELNSVACRGKKKVSDTFASSLWMADALFALARAGVDGVNVHTLPRSSYELFQFSRSKGQWRGWVRPVYYGLQLFAQAAPPGSQILKLNSPKPSTHISVWATRAPDRRLRVLAINKSPSRTRTMTIRVPPDTPSGATVERMQAPSVRSRSGVTLGGRSYGRETYTGALPPLETEVLRGTASTYTFTLPHGSAALVTFDR